MYISTKQAMRWVLQNRILVPSSYLRYDDWPGNLTKHASQKVIRKWQERGLPLSGYWGQMKAHVEVSDEFRVSWKRINRNIFELVSMGGAVEHAISPQPRSRAASSRRASDLHGYLLLVLVLVLVLPPSSCSRLLPRCCPRPVGKFFASYETRVGNKCRQTSCTRASASCSGSPCWRCTPLLVRHRRSVRGAQHRLLGPCGMTRRGCQPTPTLTLSRTCSRRYSRCDLWAGLGWLGLGLALGLGLVVRGASQGAASGLDRESGGASLM